MKERESGERRAERRAEGSRASAMARRIGAEKKSREISMVIKKKRVFKALQIVTDFSSF